MKKFFLAFAAVAALFAACSKENPTNEESNIPEESTAKVYTLTATMPATKATVDETTGKFEWESTDKIAVYDKAQGRYQVFTSTGSGSSVTFSFTATDGLSHDFSGSDPTHFDAIYPVSRIDANGEDTIQGTIIESAGDVPMTATYNGGTLEFAYDAAVVKLTVKNVPSFTGMVEFVNDNVSYIAEVNHSTNEDMTFYMIVNESTSAASEINLFDTKGQKFVAKTFNLARGPVVKGALIPLKTTVGYVLSFYNPSGAYGGNSSSSIYIWEVGGSKTHNQTSARNTYTVGDKTYEYVVMPSDWGELTRTGVKYEGAGGSTETRVFTDRNIVFTVAASQIATTYRVYLSKDSSYLYENTYAYDGNDKLGGWPGTKMGTSGSLLYVEIDETKYGETVRLWFNTGNGGKQTDDSHTWSFTDNMDQRATIYTYDNGEKLSIGNIYGWN